MKRTLWEISYHNKFDLVMRRIKKTWTKKAHKYICLLDSETEHWPEKILGKYICLTFYSSEIHKRFILISIFFQLYMRLKKERKLKDLKGYYLKYPPHWQEILDSILSFIAEHDIPKSYSSFEKMVKHVLNHDSCSST
ncbi:hypothetical protein H6775_03730 [Candidatus Nomurabacteria bacterium]|nr:hypothetical protein [Candidatus Nomurabacteria bacterium]